MFIGIWCVDNANGIGLNNKLPWSNKNELLWFKKMTSNHNIIMGRKTFESLNNKPLKNRTNIVLSKSLKQQIKDNLIIVNDFNKIEQSNNKINFIIGGKQIIETYYKKCDYIFVSNINKNYQCDTHININYYDHFKLVNYLKFKTFNVMVFKNKNIV